jgi:hypothetical protein
MQISGNLCCSREAAKEYSPRRKPWVGERKVLSPEGAKEAFLTHILNAL